MISGKLHGAHKHRYNTYRDPNTQLARYIERLRQLGQVLRGNDLSNSGGEMPSLLWEFRILKMTINEKVSRTR